MKPLRCSPLKLNEHTNPSQRQWSLCVLLDYSSDTNQIAMSSESTPSFHSFTNLWKTLSSLLLSARNSQEERFVTWPLCFIKTR